MIFRKLFILIVLTSNFLLAEEKTFTNGQAMVNSSPTQSVPQIQISKEALKESQMKTPSLGTCDPYTDYYIYKCQKFKCRLPVGAITGINREMENLGVEKGLCIHNYKFEIRNPNFPSTDLRVSCKLSEKGRLEMANQFTEYKKGNTKLYANPEFSQLLSKECNVY